MTTKLLKKTLATLVVAGLTLSLAACGGRGAKPEQTKTANSTESLQAADGNKQGEPVSGGKVTVGITQEPDSLDPHLAAAAGTKEIIYNIFEGLVKLTPQGDFEPCLAEKFELNEAADSLVFNLRQGVKFHNGQALTPADVAYSIKRVSGLLDGEDKPLIAEFADVAEVETDEEAQTVTLKLKKPNPDFIRYMTLPIIPADSEDQAQNPVGTGPFTFKEYLPQDRLVLDRNDSYWGERPAYIEQAVFKIVPSADAAMVDLQAGHLDVFPYITTDQAELIQEHYNFYDASSNMVQLWALNNDRKPFNDQRVRQALNLALDKKNLEAQLTQGQGTVLESGMSPQMGAFYNEEVNRERPADLEAARALLQEAGLGDGFELTITVPGNYVIHVRTAEIIAAQLEPLNIKVNIKEVDWGTWLTDVYQGRNYDSTVIALTFDYCAPDTVMGRYVSTADHNFVNFNSERYDNLHREAVNEMDETKRAALYREMQAVLTEEAASVFLQTPGVRTAVKKGIGGYTTYPMYVQDMYNVYVEAGR